MLERFISKIIDRITDPIYNYRKNKEKQASDYVNGKQMKQAMVSNQERLEHILQDFPQNHILIVKMSYGLWCNELNDSIPAVVSNVIKGEPWSYLTGTGLIAIDPDHYKRDPIQIALALWEPYTHLDGTVILWHRSAERK